MANDKFTAKEAKLISDSKNRELLDVLDAIENAAKSGRYELNLYEDIPTKTVEHLTERGFKVNTFLLDRDKHGDAYYNIQW